MTTTHSSCSWRYSTVASAVPLTISSMTTLRTCASSTVCSPDAGALVGPARRPRDRKLMTSRYEPPLYGGAVSENLRWYTKALYGMDHVVRLGAPDAWNNDSPCEGWTARHAIGHVI